MFVATCKCRGARDAHRIVGPGPCRCSVGTKQMFCGYLMCHQRGHVRLQDATTTLWANYILPVFSIPQHESSRRQRGIVGHHRRLPHVSRGCHFYGGQPFAPAWSGSVQILVTRSQQPSRTGNSCTSGSSRLNRDGCVGPSLGTLRRKWLLPLQWLSHEENTADDCVPKKSARSPLPSQPQDTGVQANTTESSRACYGGRGDACETSVSHATQTQATSASAGSMMPHPKWQRLRPQRAFAKIGDHELPIASYPRIAVNAQPGSLGKALSIHHSYV